MNKLALLCVLSVVFLLGCKEEERLEVHCGLYIAESVTTPVALDFTKSGQKTAEHIDRLPFGAKDGLRIEWRLKKKLRSWNSIIF